MAGKAAKSDKDKAQIERFKKKAKELEADESSEAFERAFKKIVKPAKTPNAKPPAKTGGSADAKG